MARGGNRVSTGPFLDTPVCYRRWGERDVPNGSEGHLGILGEAQPSGSHRSPQCFPGAARKEGDSVTAGPVVRGRGVVAGNPGREARAGSTADASHGDGGGTAAGAAPSPRGGQAGPRGSGPAPRGGAAPEAPCGPLQPAAPIPRRR